MKKNLVLIAPPAAGKGTMSTFLTEKYGMISISVGQLLRDIDPETELGKEIRELQANRMLVGNDIVKELLKERLSKDDIKEKGFILDGFPRTVEQAHILDDLLKELNLVVDDVVYLTVSYDLALKRTLGRRTCPSCKTVYNVMTGFNDPINEFDCRLCGGKLEKRNDDNEESFKKGFDLFNKDVLPTIEYYKNTRGVVEVYASRDDSLETFKELEEKLGLE